MTLSARWTMLFALAFALLVSIGCGGGHDGCRPNPAVTADMASLNLPAPEGGKLCHAEAKFIMYEVPKDRAAVVSDATGKMEKAGWKEIRNPSGGSEDPGTLFYEKSGKQVTWAVAKCSRSSLADIFDSCSIVTYNDDTK